MDKRFLAMLAVITAIFIGIFIFTQGSGDKTKTGDSGSDGQPTSHIKGEGQAGVTLVEYGDFQCPACAAYEPVVQEVISKYSEDIKFQFRNLPLVQIHPSAFAAARAAEAAGLQGKYWEMHDALYESSNWQNWTQSSSPQALFENYARAIGLDIEQYKQDYASAKVNSAINADLAAFEDTNLPQSTPTFFINGRHVPNDQLSDGNGPSLEKFSAVIDAEIAKQKATGGQ